MASDKPAKRQKIMSTSDDIVQVRVSAEHKLFYFQRDRLTESSLFSEQLKADPNIITFDDVDLSTFLAFTKLIDGEQIALESITADPVNIDKLLDMYAFAEKLHHVHSKNAIIDKIQDILKASNGLLTFDQFKRSFDITQPSEIRKTYRFEKNSAMYLTEPLRKLCAGLISERLALDCHIELAESVCMEIPGFLKEVARYQNEDAKLNFDIEGELVTLWATAILSLLPIPESEADVFSGYDTETSLEVASQSVGSMLM